MRRIAAMAVIILAGCGAEAPPTHGGQTTPGASVSGEMLIGVRTEL